MCDKVVCEKIVCERWCVTKLCVTKLCVKDGVCVCDKVVCESCGGGAGGRSGIHNKKQEPHTKMCGTSAAQLFSAPVGLQDESAFAMSWFLNVQTCCHGGYCRLRFSS